MWGNWGGGYGGGGGGMGWGSNPFLQGLAQRMTAYGGGGMPGITPGAMPDFRGGLQSFARPTQAGPMNFGGDFRSAMSGFAPGASAGGGAAGGFIPGWAQQFANMNVGNHGASNQSSTSNSPNSMEDQLAQVNANAASQRQNANANAAQSASNAYNQGLNTQRQQNASANQAGVNAWNASRQTSNPWAGAFGQVNEPGGGIVRERQKQYY